MSHDPDAASGRLTTWLTSEPITLPAPSTRLPLRVPAAESTPLATCTLLTVRVPRNVPAVFVAVFVPVPLTRTDAVEPPLGAAASLTPERAAAPTPSGTAIAARVRIVRRECFGMRLLLHSSG